MNGSDRTDRVSDAKPTAPIRIPRRSVADQDFLNPILSGRSRVGHKPDPDRPVDTPTYTPIPTPFFANFLLCFILLLMNSSTSSLENDDSLTKKLFEFQRMLELVFSLFFGFILYILALPTLLGDALRKGTVN